MAGIPTLEAIHTWDGGAVVLNDRRELDPATRRWRYWCERIDLRSLAEAELPADPVIAGLGAFARPGGRAGATATYEGRIEALSAVDLREATDVLLSAFLAVREERQMEVAFNPAYRSEAYVYRARGTANVLDAPRLHGVPSPYQATFVLALVRSDPRFYSTVTAGPFATGEVPALTGLRLETVIPFTIPYRSEVVSEVSFTTPGRAPTTPTVVIHGPVDRPHMVLDDTTTLELDAALAAGETAVVDFAAREVTVAGDSAPWAVVWPASNWWDNPNADLAPGPHTIRFTARNVERPGRVEISFRAAYV